MSCLIKINIKFYINIKCYSALILCKKKRVNLKIKEHFAFKMISLTKHTLFVKIVIYENKPFFKIKFTITKIINIVIVLLNVCFRMIYWERYS